MTAPRLRLVAVAALALMLPACTSADPAPTKHPERDSVRGWTVSESTVGLAPLGLRCDTLPVYTGPTKPAAGSRITGQKVTSMLDLSNGNITIERSCIQPTSSGRGMPVLTTFDYNLVRSGPKVTIRDSEIDGTKLSTETQAYATAFIGIADMTSNYIHHFGSGLALYHTGTTQSATIERNYVTDMIGYGNPATDGNHSDAFTIRDFRGTGRQATIRNNRFDCDSPNATGALFLQAYAGKIENVTIEGNLLEGDGYQLALEQHNNGYDNVRALNNRFTGTGFGPTYRTGGPGRAQWQDNHLFAADAPDAAGKPVPPP